MFKKRLNNLKTSAPLRSSDRRKLRSSVQRQFVLDVEGPNPPADGDAAEKNAVGDMLVPEGTRSVKFQTHLDEHGIAYLSPTGDPLWFTIGKGSDESELIPTIYTLWKRPGLLPFVSTPAAVIPVLVGGADLMIPGVVYHSSALKYGQLVSITEHHGASQVGPPLAVGRMGVDLPLDGQEKEKGKAVLVLHTWKDWLWDMGSKGDVPLPTPLALRADEDKEGGEAEKESLGGAADEVDTMVGAIAVLGVREDAQAEAASSPPPSAEDAVPQNTLTPQEVSEILHASLLQAIQTTLSTLPASSFPFSSSTFYTNYLLPSRPHHTTDASQTPIDIKHSTYKTLAAFLKHAEKGGLISLKSVGREKEVVVMGVAMDHPEVIGHRKHLSVREAEARKAKREEGEAEEREREGGKEMRIVQRWKPHGPSVRLFEAVGEDTTAQYTLPELKVIVNAYVTAHDLVNPRERQYVSLDALLGSVLAGKDGTQIEFLKRGEVAERLVEKMQPWYEIDVDGKESVPKKGLLKPISVITKIRQGRKASTLITNFEAYGLGADSLAEELRKTCASATSVAPVPGLKASNDPPMEVLVQGKQIKAVVELLVKRGVPKKWVEAVDLTEGKKGKS